MTLSNQVSIRNIMTAHAWRLPVTALGCQSRMLKTSRVLQAAALGAAMLDSRMTRNASGAAAEWPDAAAPPPPFTVPIFLASAVTGAAVPLLHAFLNALRPAAGPSPAGSPSPLASPGGSILRQDVGAAAAAQRPAGASAAAVTSSAFAHVGRVPPQAEQPETEPAHFQVGIKLLFLRTRLPTIHAWLQTASIWHS